MSETFISDGKLEAKVVSTTQNDKGWYIRLLLHPSDTDEVTKLRYGAVLDIRWREVLNVEVEPIEVPQTPYRQHLAEAKAETAAFVGTLRPPKQIEHKPKERFEDLPLVKQCVLTCESAEFKTFIAQYEPALFKIANGDVADTVRYACGVKSRAEIGKFVKAADAWRELYGHYQTYLTDQRHAGSRR